MKVHSMTAINKGLETLLGALVLAAALFFLVFTYQKLSIQSPLKGSYSLSALFQSVEGLTEGSPVHMAGVLVGKVRKIKLHPENFIAEVTFDLRQNVSIPRDSSAAVVSHSLLGGKFLAIKPGSDTATLAAGDVIERTQSAVNFESMLSHFIFSAESKNKPA